MAEVDDASENVLGDSARAVVRLVAPRPTGVRMGRRHARAKLEAGRPLLMDEVLDLDTAYVLRLASHLLSERASGGSNLARAALEALAMVATPARLVEEAFVGHSQHLEQLTASLGHAADPLRAALDEAVGPLLLQAASELAEFVGLTDWSRPYCPVCGSPGIGSTDSLLHCARCRTCWFGEADGRHPGVVLELAPPGDAELDDWRDD